MPSRFDPLQYAATYTTYASRFDPLQYATYINYDLTDDEDENIQISDKMRLSR